MFCLYFMKISKLYNLFLCASRELLSKNKKKEYLMLIYLKVVLSYGTYKYLHLYLYAQGSCRINGVVIIYHTFGNNAAIDFEDLVTCDIVAP